MKKSVKSAFAFILFAMTAIPSAAMAAGPCDDNFKNTCFESAVSSSLKKLDDAASVYCKAQIKKEGIYEAPSGDFSAAVSECRASIYQALSAADDGDLAALRAKGSQ